MIRVFDTCSGIGGFSLGLESTGKFETVAFCEIEDFCCKILNKHWPQIPIYNDLKELGNEPERIIQDFDLLCGGIPCQPFSQAGNRKGKEDDRHLWPYVFEIIKYKKPTWVVIENVAGFVNMALDDVSIDLESENYATQSFVIPACGIEAPHRRDRVWIVGKNVGDTTSNGRNEIGCENEGSTKRESEEGGMLESKGTGSSKRGDVVDTKCNEHLGEIRGSVSQERENEKQKRKEDSSSRLSSGTSKVRLSDNGYEGSQSMANSKGNSKNGVSRKAKSKHVEGDTWMEPQRSSNGQSKQESLQEMANSKSDRLLSSDGGLCDGNGNGLLSNEKRNGSEVRGKTIGRSRLRGKEKDVADSSIEGLQGTEQHEASVGETETSGTITESFKNDGSQWATEPNVGRVANGVPNRVDRLKALGNAIVPQVIHQIGLAIAKEEGL
tara:strand:+ start:672 stop:1988 length:1317 start_codon:yes stop_codon:yes gene_type:complete